MGGDRSVRDWACAEGGARWRGSRLAVDHRRSFHAASFAALPNRTVSAADKRRLCSLCPINMLIECSNAALLLESRSMSLHFPLFQTSPLSCRPPPHPTPSPNPSPPSFSLWLLMAWCSITRISCWEQGSIIKGLAWEITLGCRCVSPTAHYNSQLFRCFWSLTSHQVFFSVLKKIVGTLKDWHRLPRLL